MFGQVFPDGCPVCKAVLRLRLRHAARSYVTHGWPVVIGSRLCGDRFSCGPGCHTVACHPVSCQDTEPPMRRIEEPDDVKSAWRRLPFSVLLDTGDRFDVIDVPAHIGALARDVTLGPVAMTPTGRWMFFVRPGAWLWPELSSLPDVVMHTHGSWVPAPPVRSPDGSVRWVMSPRESQWRLPDPDHVQAMLIAAVPRV